MRFISFLIIIHSNFKSNFEQHYPNNIYYIKITFYTKFSKYKSVYYKLNSNQN